MVVADLWGAFHGLNLAWSLGHCKNLMELDSSCAISLIQNLMDQGILLLVLLGGSNSFCRGIGKCNFLMFIDRPIELLIL